MRPASPLDASHLRAWPTSGHRACAAGCRSFREKRFGAAAKSEIVARSESRLSKGLEKIALVSSPACGLTTTKRSGKSACRNSRGRIMSPIPSTQALAPHRKNGTSAPSVRPMACSCARVRPRRHSRFSASSVLAASDDPPPMPACAGTRLSMAMCAPSAQPVARCRARAARRHRSSGGRAALRSSRESCPAGRSSKCSVSHQSISTKTDCSRW